MSRADRVSVIIPCYNQGHLLGDAISSVLNQTHPNTEVIVVNDGSSDATSAVAHAFQGKVRLVEIANAGSSVARNTGLEHATGDWVQFLDADDVLLPEKLEACLAAAYGEPVAELTYCGYYRSGMDYSLPLQEPHLSPEMDTQHPWEELVSRWEADLSIPLHCFVFRRSLLENPPIRFDPVLPDHEDWDFVLRVVERTPVIRYVPRQLAVYRRHAGAKCRVHASVQGAGFRRAIRKQLLAVRGDRERERLLRQKLRVVEERYGLLPLWLRLARVARTGMHRALRRCDRVRERLPALARRLLNAHRQSSE